ncbi:MAG: inorganic phosphate transporter [Candidatus Hydrogenedentota bacterium]
MGPFIFGTAVAKTIGKEIVDPHVIDVWVVCGALVGAIFWNLLTWWLGFPSSSSHALVGGLGVSVIASTGFQFLKIHGFVKIVIVLITSPAVIITVLIKNKYLIR